MIDFFRFENIILAILTGFITWIITWFSFKRTLKKEENDRLRDHLDNYLDNFHNFRNLINRYSKQLNRLKEFEKYNSSNDSEYRLKEIEETFQKIEKDFEVHQYKIDSISSRLLMYDLDQYAKDIEPSLKQIQNILDSFELNTSSDPTKNTDYESIFNQFRSLDEIIKKEFHKIEQCTKQIYPK